MKKLWIVLFFFTSFGVLSQRLIDVVSNHEINDYQEFTLANTTGMSFFDFDEDGWDDLTYPMHNDSIKFYKNINGTLNQIGSYLYAEGTIRQILWVDYDNDGSLDLCISFDDSELRLYKNDGNFNFTDVSFTSGIYPSLGSPFGFSFVDFDKDQDLDLYLCNYDPTFAPNKFYENQGDGTFIDQTAQFQLDNGIQSSFMGVWFDYNNDQNIDLHIINDRGTGDDALYKNENGIFTDLADSLGVLNAGQNPMSSSISDYNNDGFQDIFITDFGLTITPLGEGPFRYKLFENQNGQSFIDMAAAKNVNADIFGWGALWVDYNNDAYEDLYVATGNNFGVTDPTTSILYRNEEGQSFTCINDSIQGDITTFSFCPVKGDINNDGFYDIAVLNKDTLPNLLLNEGNSNNYIKITPIGIVSNRMAIGSQIRVYAGGIGQLQTVFCGEQLFAQNSQHKIFGVDTVSMVDSIIINFPNGLVAKRFQIPVNQTINIYEEEYVSVPFNIYQNTDPLILCPYDTLTVSLSGFDNYLWNTGSTDSSLMITTPGTYYYEAFNTMGDTLYRSEDLLVFLEQEPLFQELTTDVHCNDDNSGIASLVFANPLGITDINWSNGELGATIDSLQTGTYAYQFTTINNCVYTGDVFVSEMEDFDLQVQTTPYTNTATGSISIYVFGGSPPYTYILDGDTITAYTSGLDAGTYALTILDGNDCLSQQSVVIENLSTLNFSMSSSEFNVFISEHEAFVYTRMNPESIEVYSMSGARVALLKKSDWVSHQNSIKFDFLHPTGIYMVVLNTPQSVLREKVFNP